MFVALLAVFISGMIYVKVNDLAREVSDLQRIRTAEIRQSRNEANLLVTHHRSGERPRGTLVVHNNGKAIATNVEVVLQRTSMPVLTPIIPGNVATIDKLLPDQRVSIDTTTERDDAWPVDVFVAWQDPRGPQTLARSVQR
jgi:hypothetical protein